MNYPPYEAFATSGFWWNDIARKSSHPNGYSSFRWRIRIWIWNRHFVSGILDKLSWHTFAYKVFCCRSLVLRGNCSQARKILIPCSLQSRNNKCNIPSLLPHSKHVQKYTAAGCCFCAFQHARRTIHVMYIHLLPYAIPAKHSCLDKRTYILAELYHC